MKQAILLIFFLLMAGLYIRESAPTVTAGDSGEFITAATTLSIPHAPSYPLFTILGKAFLKMVPWGSLPLRSNYFSSVCAALALLIIALLGFSLEAGVVTSILVAFLIGFSRSFWVNSLVTEVFALNSLWFCLILFSIFTIRNFFLTAFLLGLGLGNHQILIFFFPAILILMLIKKEFRNSPKNWMLAILIGSLGFSIYLVLPIRSKKEPPLNWGQPTTPYKLYRTITRQDYGSMKLVTGETPARNFKNCAKQLERFGNQMSRELPLVVILFAGMGILTGVIKKSPFYSLNLFLFFLFGPFFYLLGNLPFNAMADGIMGRFFIVPVILLLLGLLEIAKLFKKWGPLLLGALTVLTFAKETGETKSYRQNYLVWDYSNAMLRTLPPRSALFLDGGDDAFYSLAAQQFVLGRRNDAEIHDRGGLIFKNPYGSDFRQISPAEKEARRQEVEGRFLKERPLFFATMDPKVMPEIPLKENGFLLEANPGTHVFMPWSIILLRSVYPPLLNDYRTLALAAFFPYFEGQTLINGKKFEKGLRILWRSQVMGKDVTWLRVNLAHLYGQLAYDNLQNGNLGLAEKVYRQWLLFDPDDPQPNLNLGVTLERMGKIGEAEKEYWRVMNKFPEAPDPVYNLAVLNWKKGDWPAVVKYLEEVLKRNPQHEKARYYLEDARRRLGQR